MEFTYKKVDYNDPKLMEQIYRLRFEVYCYECGFIKAADYPDGLEIDEYDAQATHFAAINDDGDLIGTIRMIHPGRALLPIEQHCPQIVLSRKIVPDSKINFTEISRLIISKRLRRRKNDAMYYEPQVEDQKMIDAQNQEFIRRARPMAFGLYREMYQESKRKGITNWYSLMEKSLWLLLRLHGFRFDAIGEEVDVYGPVRPYMANIPEIEEEVYRKFPQFYEYFVRHLEKEYLPNFSQNFKQEATDKTHELS
jgi:N-acyl amino acid synthase of PEP-CTERM/exosortase system